MAATFNVPDSGQVEIREWNWTAPQSVLRILTLEIEKIRRQATRGVVITDLTDLGNPIITLAKWAQGTTAPAAGQITRTLGNNPTNYVPVRERTDELADNN